MKLLLTLTLLVVFLLSSPKPSFAQRNTTAPPAKLPSSRTEANAPTSVPRNVTVHLKNGDPIKGAFVSGSSVGVQISVAGNTLTIKWNDLAQLTFTEAKESSDSSVTSIQASTTSLSVENALKSLRKLAAATEVGVNFQDYSRRVIDVKAEVEDYLAKIPDGYQKEEIKLAMQAYADAGTAWNQMIRHDYLFPEFEPGKTLQPKYSIPIDNSLGMAIMPRRVVLSTIWGAARKHIENVTSPAKSPVVQSSGEPTGQPSKEQPPTNVSIEGRWNVTSSIAGQTASFTLSFAKLDTAYIGTMANSDGAIALMNLVVDGKRFSFSASDRINNQEISMNATGDIQGEALSGTIKLSASTGQTVEGRLSGVRIK